MQRTDFMFRFTTEKRYRILLPLIAFVVVASIATVMIGRITDTYRASARIWVQRSAFGNARGPQPGELPESPLMEVASNLITFCEVVTSDSVLSMAYEDLTKRLPTEKLPGRGAMGGIRVTPTKDANIINVEYEADDPEVAAAVVDSMITALMKENAIQIAGPLEETRERLEKQLELARRDYAASKERLKEFASKNSSVSFDDEAGALSLENADLEHQLGEANNEMKVLNTKLEYLQTQLGFGPDDVLAVEKISNDEVVKGLRQTIADAQVKLIELKSKFQEEHPRVKRIRSVLDDAKKDMEARYSALIGKVDPKFEGISENHEIQHQMLMDMVQARAETVIGNSRIQSLQNSLSAVKSRLAAIPEKQQEFADLNRRDELATNTLAAVESELERVKLTESVSLSSSRMQVIQSSQSVQNMAPRFYAVGYGVALMAALLVAVAQHFLDPRIKTVHFLRNVPFKVLGWYPKLTNDLKRAIQPADRLRLGLRGSGGTSNVYWVTSATVYDGKSLVARSLAQSFADAGTPTILVDANLERPVLHLALDCPASPGLVQCLQSDDDFVEDALVEIEPNLKFLPAGSVSGDLRTLSGVAFENLVRNLKQHGDVIIVDSPAAGRDDYGLHMADVRPHVLLVVRFCNTLKRGLSSLVQQLEMQPVDDVSIVLNQITSAMLNKLPKDSVGASVDVVAQLEKSMEKTAEKEASPTAATW